MSPRSLQYPLSTLFSRPAQLHPLPPSSLYYEPCRTDGICPRGPHPWTILADLRPLYSIPGLVRACPPLVVNGERRHAGALEQLIYSQHQSFRSQSLRLFKLGVPEHWRNRIPVQTSKCTSRFTPVIYVSHTFLQQKPVVAVSGENGRSTFLTAKGFDIHPGFKDLLGGVNSRLSRSVPDTLPTPLSSLFRSPWSEASPQTFTERQLPVFIDGCPRCRRRTVCRIVCEIHFTTRTISNPTH